jgi:hypothetical protein
MYEVFHLIEAYVVWKITIELNKSHEMEANKNKPGNKNVKSQNSQ